MVKFGIKIFAVILVILFASSVSFAIKMDSGVGGTVSIEVSDVNTGGCSSDSDSFIVFSSIGQSTPIGKHGWYPISPVGKGARQVNAGFIYMIYPATSETILRQIRANEVVFHAGDIIAHNANLEIDFLSANPLVSVEVTCDKGTSYSKKFTFSKMTPGWGIPDNTSQETWGGRINVTPRVQELHTMNIYISDEALSSKNLDITCRIIGGSVQVVGTPLNYPNPFKPLSGGTTKIQYTLSTDTPITIIIYDITGHERKRMSFAAGSPGGQANLNSVTWNGKSFYSDVVGNGMYIYKIISGDKVLGTGKLVILD
jgi:hypothetical protein